MFKISVFNKTLLSTAIQVRPDRGASPHSNDAGMWESKIVGLKTKLIYSVRNLVSRPTYFLTFTLARFRICRQIYAFCSKFKSHSTTHGDRHTESLFELDPTTTVDILKRDGVVTGLNLPPQFLNELQQYLQTQDCYAGGKEHLGFRLDKKKQLEQIFQQPFYVARYYNLSTDCPQISQLANDPKLREIAAGYIGTQARYAGASLFWTFPIEGASVDSDQQMFSHFHYDIDDFAGLRFCFYLTDVTLNDGPHVCIKGSHIQKRIRYILNFFSRIQTAAELTKTYSSEKFVTIAGNSGSGFIEDTFCFHRGNPPKNNPRLFLQLHFVARNYSHRYLDERDSSNLCSWQESLLV